MLSFQVCNVIYLSPTHGAGRSSGRQPLDSNSGRNLCLLCRRSFCRIISGRNRTPHSAPHSSLFGTADLSSFVHLVRTPSSIQDPSGPQSISTATMVATRRKAAQVQAQEAAAPSTDSRANFNNLPPDVLLEIAAYLYPNYWRETNPSKVCWRMKEKKPECGCNEEPPKKRKARIDKRRHEKSDWTEELGLTSKKLRWAVFNGRPNRKRRLRYCDWDLKDCETVPEAVRLNHT
jgi:hypothetical protein